MKEWFLSSDLMVIEGLPGSTAGISKKARKENWKSRKAKGSSRAIEYHISSFDEETINQLREYYGNTADVTPIKGNASSMLKVSDIEMYPIPVYNVYAACGFGRTVDSEYQLRMEFLPSQRLKKFNLDVESARIISCHGDSMEDTLSDGDEVLVDIREQEHPVKNGVYVIRIGQNVFIKRLKYNIIAESYDVISDNKSEYDPFTLTANQLEDFAVIGKVVTTVMKAVF
ncbi:transcriptional regulator [Aliivibrio fischeri]|uniref:helix-turn-helix domain-containing protein n=1 Tax=Aliivibrio fischeri TaxID=668 RepID=UPI00080E33FD|nr:LexA family transcriptional regulator [Aliivibrio fischeri]MUH96375.1 S24 family peptidase [Aliivibrio fischeri]MUI63945.1 S24 family peptidase [Aliivibrio fischeri]OCH58356.1 transcriptional regulator [Aliivibrio fischeri]